MNDQKDIEEGWECYICLDEHIHTPPVVQCRQCNRGTICSSCVPVMLEFNYMDCGLCNHPFREHQSYFTQNIKVFYFIIIPFVYYVILCSISIYTLQHRQLSFIESFEFSLCFYSIYCILFLFLNVIFIQLFSYWFRFENIKLIMIFQNFNYILNIITCSIISMYSTHENMVHYFIWLFITLFLSHFIFFYSIYISLYCYHQRLQYL